MYKRKKQTLLWFYKVIERSFNQSASEGDSRIPKRATDKKFQIQNNLASSAPVFRSRLKQRLKQAKTVVQTSD